MSCRKCCKRNFSRACRRMSASTKQWFASVSLSPSGIGPPSTRSIAMSSRHDWVIWLLFVSGLALIWAFAVLPVFNAIWLSLHTASSFIGTPRWAGLDNYVSLLTDPDFWRATEIGFIY